MQSNSRSLVQFELKKLNTDITNHKLFAIFIKQDRFYSLLNINAFFQVFKKPRKYKTYNGHITTKQQTMN